MTGVRSRPGWLRTPFLLLRFRGVLLAVAAGVLTLALASAASPLFLDSASTAAVRQAAARGGAVPAFSAADYSDIQPDVMAYRDRILDEALAGLAPPIRSILAGQTEITRVGGDGTGVRVVPMFRTAAESHIERVGPVDGEGAFIAASAARALGVDAGDAVTLDADLDVRVRIVGVYRDLSEQATTAFWTPLNGLIYRTSDRSPPPPTFLIMPREMLARAGLRLGTTAQFRWEYGLADPDLTLADARALSARIRAVQSDIGSPTSKVGTAFTGTSHSSPVPTWVAQAEETVAGITAPVETLALAGRIVALVVVAAAGMYAVHRRRVEYGLLHARGISPVRMGARAAVEAALPAAVAGVLGWGAGVLLVQLLGPSDRLTAGAVADAMDVAAWTVAAGVVLLAIVAANAARSQAEQHAGAGRLRQAAAKVPWEAVVLVLAAASMYEVVTRSGDAIVATTGPPRVDRLLLLFPILFVAGGAGLVVRGLGRALPRLRVRGSRSHAVYLAVRRLAASPRMALLLVTASSLAVGMLAYSSILSASIERTADVKALLSVGSDVALPLGGRGTPIPEVPSTPVARVVDMSAIPGEVTVDLLQIDSRTFGDAAFWDDGVMGAALPEVLTALRGDVREALPAVVAGGNLPTDAVLDVGDGIRLRVTRTLDAFPGMVADRPLVVVDAQAFMTMAETVGISTNAYHELWLRGDPGDVVRILRDKGLNADVAVTATAVRDTPSFLALSWTFDFLGALGVMAGAIGLAGMLLYLQARQRSREVSYTLARRMGLTRGAHRRSVVLELAAMLVTAAVLGALLASIAALTVHGRLDPLPTIPPAPLLVIPLTTFAVVLAAAGVAAFVGAAGVQRRADRANIAEVMRLAT